MANNNRNNYYTSRCIVLRGFTSRRLIFTIYSHFVMWEKFASQSLLTLNLCVSNADSSCYCYWFECGFNTLNRHHLDMNDMNDE